ncbi:MAG TPA: hypothetical protein VF899_22190 [Pyrinomonadaceae bacterium]
MSQLIPPGHEHADSRREHYYSRNPPYYVRADAIDLIPITFLLF